MDRQKSVQVLWPNGRDRYYQQVFEKGILAPQKSDKVYSLHQYSNMEISSQPDSECEFNAKTESQDFLNTRMALCIMQAFQR